MSPNPLQNILDKHLPASAAGSGWPEFLQYARAEHLSGILFDSCRKLKVPDFVSCALRQTYYANLASNTYRLQAIEALEAILNKEQITILVVKGAALLDHVYSDPGMRPMEDIDLLVKPEDFHRMAECLKGCGYIRDEAFGHMFSKNGVLLDVHTHLLHTDRIAMRHALFPGGMNSLRADSRPFKPGFRNIFRPDDADHLIFLAHHMIKHSFSRVIWMVDACHLLYCRDLSFWKKLARKTAACRQERPVACMLYVIGKMFGIEPPEGSGFEQVPHVLTRYEKAILNIRVRDGNMGDLGNILWMLCLNGWSNRLRFLGEALFPEKEIMRRGHSVALGIKQAPLYLHRSLRLLHLLSRNLPVLARLPLYRQKH